MTSEVGLKVEYIGSIQKEDCSLQSEFLSQMREIIQYQCTRLLNSPKRATHYPESIMKSEKAL
jgi:hypothetical protein